MGMSNYKIPTVSVLVLFIMISFCTQTLTDAAPAAAQKAYINYIKIKCSKVTYPPLCAKNLYPYASYVRRNPIRLCNAALSLAIKGARNASASITRLAARKGISRYEAAAFRDCIGNMKDTVYELRDTLDAMAHLRDSDREFQWSNAKTRASAAISDAESCQDGFSGKKVNPIVKKKIRSYVAAVEKLISNALFLINHIF